MNRLAASIRNDILLQHRNQLYAISVAVGVLVAGLVAGLASPPTLARALIVTILLFAGGSTLLYVVAMIQLEKGDRTLTALTVTPLRPAEYLVAKTLTLSALGTLEAMIMTVGAGVWLGVELPAPGRLSFVFGTFSLGAIQVLIGVIIAVRYDHITDALVPMGGVGALLQLPALHFAGALDAPWLLWLPSGPRPSSFRAPSSPSPFRNG
ncbi:MAG: ABC transporter permease [Myxococcota bacterium]